MAKKSKNKSSLKGLIPKEYISNTIDVPLEEKGKEEIKEFYKKHPEYTSDHTIEELNKIIRNGNTSK